MDPIPGFGGMLFLLPYSTEVDMELVLGPAGIVLLMVVLALAMAGFLGDGQ